MSNSIYKSKYEQTIDVNPMSLYSGSSIFSSNTLTPIYSDMYIPSRSLNNRGMEKYRNPTVMMTMNKKIALWGAGIYVAIGVFSKGRSIKATGKLLLNMTKGIGSFLSKAGKSILQLFKKSP